MPTRAVVLFSGGLDSMLAVQLLKRQGIEVEALCFRTLFTCCQADAQRGAHELDVRLTVCTTGDDYLDVVKKPKWGYGRGANPCIDCRIYMFQGARRLMEQIGAQFVASGEVLGQRPMSQKRRDLELIAHHAGLADRLLRPLSAKQLPITLPERDLLVDREQLFGFTGRSRKGLIALATELGLKRIPSPSSGCALTDPAIGERVLELIELSPDAGRWDFELLKIGRHIQLPPDSKLVLGRREEENRQLAAMASQRADSTAALIEPENFEGPSGLVVGVIDDHLLEMACSHIAVRAKLPAGESFWAKVTRSGQVSRIAVACPATSVAR